MFKPLGNRVIVRPAKEEQQSAGGILLPDTARKRPQEGEVLAVGSGRILDSGSRVPVSLKVGDTVIYSKYAGTHIQSREEDLVFLEEDSILAVRE